MKIKLKDLLPLISDYDDLSIRVGNTKLGSGQNIRTDKQKLLNKRPDLLERPVDGLTCGVEKNYQEDDVVGHIVIYLEKLVD